MLYRVKIFDSSLHISNDYIPSICFPIWNQHECAHGSQKLLTQANFTLESKYFPLLNHNYHVLRAQTVRIFWSLKLFIIFDEFAGLICLATRCFVIIRKVIHACYDAFPSADASYSLSGFHLILTTNSPLFQKF